MYELIVVWNSDESKNIYKYHTEKEAKDGLKSFQMAFGNQCWCCIRKKIERR